MENKIKIAVAGTGYVGLSIATLLSQHHHVEAVDVIPEKVEMINNRKSPIQDEYIEKYLAEKQLDLHATTDGATAYKDADFVVIATPTNYDSVKNYFDTSHVEEVIELVMKVNPNAIMVIKSTIPVGYTESVRKKYNCDNIIFAPEFLRESKALCDNLYPSRIIVGRPEGDKRLDKAAHTFAALLQEGAIKEDIPTLFMGLTEAEAVKLFANTYSYTRALKGKKVLVVHPYADTIERQYHDNRKNLFDDKEFLPEFASLQTVKAVQTIAGNTAGYNSWFEALEDMERQISTKDFDIALLGCGAYGFPLAAYIKSLGKQAIHMGGQLQLLFGIKGKRWDGAWFYNKYWVRPSENERPQNLRNVEDGAYW